MILSVFVRELFFIEEELDGAKTNQILLDGYICKQPVYRKTPLGREIADLLLAVNRPYGKSDYIPCICWGRNARFASAFEVGEHVQVVGRIQSREYTKKITETETQKRVAYEVSVSKLECMDEPGVKDEFSIRFGLTSYLIDDRISIDYMKVRRITMAIFTGAGVAIVTPFNEDGSINYDRLDELIEFHCAHKTDSIVICGTTGESATMTEEEHMQCVKFTIDRVNKRVPVIAGTGSNCTRTAIDMSKEASEYGADGLLLVTPYYNKATQNGLIGHFSAVAKEVTAPIIMYSVASRTGCNIEPATVARLVKDVDNIVGIKEASGNISQVAKIMNLTDGNVDLYSGNDDQIVPVLSLGGKGVISVLSNVAPDAAHDICEKYFEGDVKGSAELQLKALPLIDQLFCEVNPIPVKKAMQLMGIDCGPLRMPLTEISPEHEKNLAQAMKDFGIQLV